MKKLIFQYYIGKLPDWAKTSIKRFEKYAKVIDAEYLFSNTANYSGNPYFENLRVVYDRDFLKYDKVLYADVDVIVENFQEDIFDTKIKDIGLVPEYTAKGMNATPLFMTKDYVDYWKRITTELQFNVPYLKPKTVEAEYLMFNSGVILWSRAGIIKAKQNFDYWRKWNYVLRENPHLCLDQPFITAQVSKYLDYTEMPLKWNCFPRFRFDSDQIPEEINFVHYTGGKKKYITELYSDEN